MNISEQELRDMVRAAIANGRPQTLPAARPAPGMSHASHERLALSSGGDEDGRCLIEPSVFCTHCGYCQSLGH